MGGGVDIQGTLKGYYQANNMPDIFVNGAIPDFENWEGKLVDMSDEAWVADTDAAYVDEEYGTIGFPYTVQRQLIFTGQPVTTFLELILIPV